MRVLHLIDPSGPGGGACTLRLAADVLASEAVARHEVLIIGNAGHLALARRCGLAPRGGLGAPLNQPGLALGALRGLLRSRERAGGAYDLVHAWTLTSAVAALRAGARRVLVTAAAAAPLGSVGRRRLRRAEVLALGPGAARHLESAGVRFRGTLPGGVAHGAIAFEERALLRQGWGVDATCFVVGLLGDPPQAADGDFAINAVGRAALAGRDVRLVLHHGSAPPGGLRRWLGRLRLEHVVVVDDRMAEPWRVLSGLDAALLVPRRREQRRAAAWWSPPGLADHGPGSAPPTLLPLPWAMAAGLPVIAARGGAAELIEDGSSGRIFDAGDFNAVTAMLLDLFADPALCRRLGSAARRRVESMQPETVAAQLGDAYLGTRWGQAPRAVGAAGAPGAAPAQPAVEGARSK